MEAAKVINNKCCGRITYLNDELQCVNINCYGNANKKLLGSYNMRLSNKLEQEVKQKERNILNHVDDNGDNILCEPTERHDTSM